MNKRFDIARFNQLVYWMLKLNENYHLNNTTDVTELTNNWDEIDMQLNLLRNHNDKEFNSADNYFRKHFGETFDRIPF